MARRKRPKKKKISQPLSLTQEEQKAVSALLREMNEIDPARLASRIPDSRHAQAVVEQVRLDAPVIPFLIAVKERFADKNVQKAVKKALFKLKQRGLGIEEYVKPGEDTASALKAPRIHEPEVFVGPLLDMSGSRALLLIHYRTMKTPHVGAGMVSHREGIRNFLYGPFSRKKTRQMMTRLEEFAGPLVTTSFSHAAAVLEQAYQKHMENHPDAPPDYLELRPWLLREAPPLDHPAVYDIITRDSTADRDLTDSDMDKLFQHRLLKPWRIEFEGLRPYIEELRKIEDSPLILAEAQKSDQAARIREKCMKELFPLPERLLFRHMLEEMAFFFFKTGEEDYARLCLNAAAPLDRENENLLRYPVIAFFVELNISEYMKMIQGARTEDAQQTEETPSGLIIM